MGHYAAESEYSRRVFLQGIAGGAALAGAAGILATQGTKAVADEAAPAEETPVAGAGEGQSVAPKPVPQNASQMGLVDDDSGMHLFRGIISPFDQIKSFKETYTFAGRFGALFGNGLMNALRIIEPDYAKRTSSISEHMNSEMRALWSDPALGMVEDFRKNCNVPDDRTFGCDLAHAYAHFGDATSLIADKVIASGPDHTHVEGHCCAIDLLSPETCDLAIGGGDAFMQILSNMDLNVYMDMRRGCGDGLCRTTCWSVREYGEDSTDQYSWEHWCPPQDLGEPTPEAERMTECPFLNTGVYESPYWGATWTAGQMYQSFKAGGALPMSAYIVQAIREFEPNAERANHVIACVMDAAGHWAFGDREARKALRNWLGVPNDVDDGRVMAAYISMVFQARGLDWKFVSFEPESCVLEVTKMSHDANGQYPEYAAGCKALFNGMVKAVVSPEWYVDYEDDAEAGVYRVTVAKGLCGFRRQTPGAPQDRLM